MPKIIYNTIEDCKHCGIKYDRDHGCCQSRNRLEENANLKDNYISESCRLSDVKIVKWRNPEVYIDCILEDVVEELDEIIKDESEYELDCVLIVKKKKEK